VTQTPRYQPYYCEENVWWLLQSPTLAGRKCWAVFISGAAGSCQLWRQRVAHADSSVIWDYHVIALTADAGQAEVWDLDTRIGLPVALTDYLGQTFRPLPPGHEILAPLFRLVEADTLLARFSSDRSHMRNPAGDWIQPPPPWSAPQAAGQSMNLQRFIDMRDEIAGDVLGQAELRRRFGPDLTV